MKRQLLLAIIVCGVAAGLFFKGAVAGQRKRPKAPVTIQEETVPVFVPPASPTCTNLVREFIAYISREKPDIRSDKQAQDRWLSDSLRKAFAHRLAVYQKFNKKNPDSPESPPGNGDFVGSWNYPTTYQIAATRVYNQRAIIDVIFAWGPNTEYPGDKRLVSYVLVREGPDWKIEDLYTLHGEFVAASSLNQTFFSDSYP